MSCDRCSDIHTAQKEGKTSKKCECDCHISYSSSGGGETITCTCNQTFTSVNPCPVHGSGFLFTTGSGGTANIALDNSGANIVL